jgi:hypothetical protein
MTYYLLGQDGRIVGGTTSEEVAYEWERTGGDVQEVSKEEYMDAMLELRMKSRMHE